MASREAVECIRCGTSFRPRATTVDTTYCSQCRYEIKDGQPEVRSRERRDSLKTGRQMKAAAPAGKRWCNGCARYRAEKFFGQFREGVVSRWYPRCKSCRKEVQRASMLTRTYNITADQYAAIKEHQGGKCAICQRATGASKALAVDHDHSCCYGKTSCGKCVRGLLCSLCNKLLGHALDDPAMFQRAIEYLRISPARAVLDVPVVPVVPAASSDIA